MPVADTERPRRRLPVLNDRPEEGEAEPRPAWHWIVLTAVATLLGWLLSAALVNALGGGVGANAAALALSAGLAGAMTGRFGAKAGPRHAMLGAALTAAFGCALAYRALADAPLALVVTAIVACSVAALGAMTGLWLTRRRARG